MNAGARAHVDHVVGRKDRFLVVFHDQNGIAEIAEALQADQKAGVVALVQADGRLIEHIEHARQA